jgi:ferrous-iron efflux pump FieF
MARPAANEIKPQMALMAGGIALGTVLVLIIIKAWAYADNGSVAVLASLIDSIADAGASLIMFLAIRFSLKPADSEHRYGHGKVEGLAALFQAAFILGTAFFLLLESGMHAAAPIPVKQSTIAITIMGISAFLSFGLISAQTYILKKAPSLAVEADRAHYSMDVVINLGALCVLWAMASGAPFWIDPLFGIAVSLYLGFTVKSIAGMGLDMLLDRELPGDARELITNKVLSHRYVLGMHDLRTHKSGMRVFISFDMELDPSLLLYNAHEIVREVEHELLVDFPNAEILIHVDPYGDTHDTRHNVAGVHHN